MILFLVAAVAVAVRANSPSGRRDLISPTRPHYLRKRIFLASVLTPDKYKRLLTSNHVKANDLTYLSLRLHI